MKAKTVFKIVLLLILAVMLAAAGYVAYVLID